MITGVLSGHSRPLNCVALSQDNSYVVSGNEDGTIVIHSTKTGIVEYRADNVFTGGVYVFAIFRTAHLWLVDVGGLVLVVNA